MVRGLQEDLDANCDVTKEGAGSGIQWRFTHLDHFVFFDGSVITQLTAQGG